MPRNDLFWLTAVLAATALMTFPYVLNRFLVRGLWGTLRNPAAEDRPLAEWAQRAQRAHYNAIENLAVFAPTVLTLQFLKAGNAMTSGACAMYFGARLLHYLVYAAGIPVLRTFAFLIGWVAIAILILRALGAA
jgi:uncharacterized MAPEG superfamily protein